MIYYSLEPRDTVCFRDGAGALGNAMRTLPFPWPSSTAGLMRTRAGLNEKGRFDVPIDRLPELRRNVRCRGPLLARFERSDGALELFASAPADVVWFDDGTTPADSNSAKRAQRFPLKPVPVEAGIVTDLDPALQLVGLDPSAPRSKPLPGPAFWRWTELHKWLLAPASQTVVVADVGIAQFAVEEGVHAAIDSLTSTAADGDLFSIEGLRLGTRGDAGFQRFGFVVAAEVKGFREPKDGVVAFGGKRRPTFLRHLNGFNLPTLPNELANSNELRFRIVLLTPAVFDGGFLPASRMIGGARIIAAAVSRPQVISGWDFARDRPKPSRRVVPAGTVYWVELGEGTPSDAWLRTTWLSTISDNEEDCADGFGLVAIGRA